MRVLDSMGTDSSAKSRLFHSRIDLSVSFQGLGSVPDVAIQDSGSDREALKATSSSSHWKQATPPRVLARDSKNLQFRSTVYLKSH